MAGYNDISSAQLDKVANDIQRLPDALREKVVSEGLDKAGEIISETLVGTMAQKKYPHVKSAQYGIGEDDMWLDDIVDTGDLARSIKAQKRISGRSASVTVKPTGNRSDGKSNAEVAFHLNFGTRKFLGANFIEEAVEAATDDVTAAIADIVDDVLDQIY